MITWSHTLKKYNYSIIFISAACGTKIKEVMQDKRKIPEVVSESYKKLFIALTDAACFAIH